MKQTYSKRCDYCNKLTRVEKAVQWYDKTNKDQVYYYCLFCFNAYKAGLMKMSRNPINHIQVIKGAEMPIYENNLPVIGVSKSDTM